MHANNFHLIKRAITAFVATMALFFILTGCNEEDIKTESDPILDVKLDDKNTISSKDLERIKIGDSYKRVLKILNNPKEIDEEGFIWNYDGDNSFSSNSYAAIFFDFENNVESIEQSAITEKNTTRKDEDGVINFDNPKKSTGTHKETSETPDEETASENEDYIYDVESAIAEAVGETVEWVDETLDVVDHVEVNDNYGKNDGSKLILAHLNSPVSLTSNLTKKTVQKQTLEIAKEIKESQTLNFEIDSITYFWYLPLTGAAGNTERKLAYKIQLERDTLDNLNYDSLNSIDLPAIADQYNVMFND